MFVPQTVERPPKALDKGRSPSVDKVLLKFGGVSYMWLWPNRFFFAADDALNCSMPPLVSRVNPRSITTGVIPLEIKAKHAPNADGPDPITMTDVLSCAMNFSFTP